MTTQHIGKISTRMGRLKLVTVVFTLLIPGLCIASSHYGVTFSYPAIAKEPPTLHGYQIMLNYDPQKFKWRKFNVYFDAGFSHFWITNTPYYRTLSIYSIAPVIRYSFKKRWIFSPYLELSVGLAYLNHTRIDDRNLGMHPAFQDRVGIGTFIGPSKQFSIGMHAVHYSNAHLCANNSGISIPMDIDIGYRF